MNRLSIAQDDKDAARLIETELLRSVRGALPQARNSDFVLSVRHEGALVGGVTGSTSYGWLLVKCLWVAEYWRQQGLGKSLMAAIEQKARDIGCHAAWLDTSSPDALAFYARLGYAPFGQLANTEGQHPPTHRRWFMSKAL
jgi:GNAT superfamily N-acetyltransferase